MSTVEPTRYELMTTWSADVLTIAEELTENLDTEGLIELVKRINGMADPEFSDEMQRYFNEGRTTLDHIADDAAAPADPTVSRKEVERHLFYAVPGLLDPHSGDFDALLSAAIGAVMMAGIEITE